MNTLPEMLTEIARRHAGRPAVVSGESTLTYQDLYARVAALATELSGLGVQPGDRVGVLLRNSPEFVVAYLGASAAGAVIVPLNEHYQETELLYFLDVCDVSTLITAQEYASLCQAVLPQCRREPRVIMAEGWAAGGNGPKAVVPAVTIDPDAPAMYQFSSGSTGTPKRIARSHAKLLFELNSLVDTLGITPDDRYVGAAPFSHVNGLMRSMLSSLRAGAALYPLPRFDRQAAAELIERNGLTVFIAVPFMFSVLAQSTFRRRRPDFSSLRLCISASAPMPARFNRLFHDNFGSYVRQLYGSTETGTISVNLRPDVEATLEAVGTPIAGVRVDVFGDDGRPTPPGEMGEFAVASPAAITTYEGASDEINREAFRDGYFFTGDLGRKEADGTLYLAGRKKFFINKAGFKIDPREIEELLETHPKILEAVVLGVPSTYGDERVKAVLVASEPCSPDEIVAHCRGKIADFKVPSLIEFRESLPKSPTGKIRRGMLL
jgi:long-chain acyl-CoA synthetase